MLKLIDISDLNLTVAQLKKFSSILPFIIRDEKKLENGNTLLTIADGTKDRWYEEVHIEADKEGNIITGYDN